MKHVEGIVRFIKKQIEGAEGAVVGLSGGIDSSVVAALCVRALGKDKVVGIGMPARGITLRKDVDDARSLAEQLGIRFYVYPVDGVVNELQVLHTDLYNHSLAAANSKARARMMILYAYANIHDYRVAGTGNKSELSVGYFTKHGDGAELGMSYDELDRILQGKTKDIAADKVKRVKEYVENSEHKRMMPPVCL